MSCEASSTRHAARRQHRPGPPILRGETETGIINPKPPSWFGDGDMSGHHLAHRSTGPRPLLEAHRRRFYAVQVQLLDGVNPDELAAAPI
jgi:hypothetical protein